MVLFIPLCYSCSNVKQIRKYFKRIESIESVNRNVQRLNIFTNTLIITKIFHIFTAALCPLTQRQIIRCCSVTLTLMLTDSQRLLTSPKYCLLVYLNVYTVYIITYGYYCFLLKFVVIKIHVLLFLHLYRHFFSHTFSYSESTLFLNDMN